MNPDDPPEEPSDLEEPADPTDASDLDFADMPCTDGDDGESQWEAFIPDEDERDPEPDPGDFWLENDRSDRPIWGIGDTKELGAAVS
jgi:hypothetical protein